MFTVVNQSKVKKLDVETITFDEISRWKFDFQHYFKNTPVVFKGAAVNWTAFKKWQPEYFKDVYGDRSFRVAYNHQGVFNYCEDCDTGAVESLDKPMHEIVDLISKENSTYYLKQCNMKRDFPELLQDIDPPKILRRLKEILVINFWFGGGGCKSPLHFDRADNFFVQLLGKKRVTLFPPSAGKYLYPSEDKKRPHISRVNIFAPDEDMYPLLKDAKKEKIVVELEPGDVLYIPSLWWHGVESLGTSISVNIWWAGSVSIALFRFRMFMRSLFTRRAA